MNYRVTWLPSADRTLIDLWIAAPDRAELTAAANRIESSLERDPLGVGESRSGGVRILIDSPLAIYYTVDTAHRSVLVWDVWRVA